MPKPLRKSEAAAMVGVNPATLDRWGREGLIPALVLPSGQRRYRQADLLEFTRPRRGRPQADNFEGKEAEQ
jgi:DNA-binding transcriptional MerR regulator